MGYAGEVKWMNDGNAMLGFTAQREKWASNGFTMLDEATGQVRAWWQNSDFKLGYEDAIPVTEVHKHLLHWTSQEADIAVKLYLPAGTTEDVHGEDDGGQYRWIADGDRKAIVRPDNGAIFGYFGRDSYQTHDYMPVLEQCQNIADGELGIASAFLMDLGAVFIINMELPEDITTTAGIDHRVRLMACTSQNGRFATIWKIVDEFSVCSNSFNLQLAGSGNEFRVKHTAKSLGKINDARTALGLVYKAAEEYTRFLDMLTEVDITDAQFKAITAGLFPIPEPTLDGNDKVSNARAITNADGKQSRLFAMWNSDPRVAPFNGTLFGAFNAFSTWNQWERPRDNNTLEASIMGTVDGSFGNADAKFFDIVQGLDIDLGALVA